MLEETQSYLPEHEFSSAVPMMDETELENLLEGIRNNIPHPETFGFKIFEALSASIGQSFQQTINFPLKGHETTYWGDLGDWILIDLFRCLIESPQKYICLQQSNALQDIIGAADLTKLLKLYSLRNPSLVKEFFVNYPILISVLGEAHQYLVKYFGANSYFELEIVKDSEAKQGEELMAYIVTSLPVDEALDRLNKFDDEWFLDQLDRVGSLLNFNLEIL